MPIIKNFERAACTAGIGGAVDRGLGAGAPPSDISSDVEGKVALLVEWRGRKSKRFGSSVVQVSENH